jgi:hypothetical protein
MTTSIGLLRTCPSRTFTTIASMKITGYTWQFLANVANHCRIC